MKNSKSMLEDIFTWQDIFNFCLENYSFGYSILEKGCNRKKEVDMLIPYIRKFIGDSIRKEFPDFPFDDEFFHYYFYIKKDDKQVNLYLDISKFFRDLLTASANRKLDYNQLTKMLSTLNPNLKENIIDSLNSYKNQINEDISKCGNDIIMGYNPDFGIMTTKEELKQTLLAKRRMIVWVIRHYDELLTFLQRPVDLDVFRLLNKDKFLLVMTSFALKESGILSDIKDSSCEKLQVIHNYILLMQYLGQELQEEYYMSFSTDLSNGRRFLMSSSMLLSEYQKYYNTHKEQIDSYHFCSSYEEILSQKAHESWKKMQNQKLAKKIKLNWEMIPAGNKISLSNYQAVGERKITSSNEAKQAQLQKDYHLVEEKINYFSATNPLFELTGINTFEGYSAYMYSNGVVVFEKFFKNSGDKQRGMLIPVSGEAIYIMNFKEFADLSKYTKVELIQEISQYQNPDVKRILHTANGSWKDRVTKVITGPGYGELDLEQIDTLALELSNKNKQLVK